MEGNAELAAAPPLLHPVQHKATLTAFSGLCLRLPTVFSSLNETFASAVATWLDSLVVASAPPALQCGPPALPCEQPHIS